MQEFEDTMSSECSENVDSQSTVKLKPKKRSIIERELETNLTEKITSPVVNGGGSTSRYGRSRRSKGDTNITTTEPLTSPKSEHIAYKMHASNSPVKMNNASPIRTIKIEHDLDDQIANIYNENIMLSRFGSDKKKDLSPVNNPPKVYVRKDLIQKKDSDDKILLIKDMFSPSKSNSHLNNILERDKFNMKSKSPKDPSSVVKTLDFDSGKSKKRNTDKSKSLTKSELFEMEAKCAYQVGDLVWARMGTFPFWPCLVTRDPLSAMFVKKKLFGRIERDVIHVTFFADNGRRGWIVENMLRPFTSVLEFEATRDKFTPEARKKDPRLYAAFFVSDKRLPQWNLSIGEAEALQREPKRLRIDVYNEILSRYCTVRTTPKSRGKIDRADSDVSLSESLYDTLFSEDDGKSDEDKCKNKRKNKSFDVSDVVTACLDNMAAKTGITKIQRQSHMDRWLQKAKSKTPEKNQLQKLSKSLLLDKTPKKENDNKTKKSNSKRKSTSSVETNRKSQRNRRSLNRSANIDQVNDENTKVISNQMENNHVYCNGDIDHSLDTTVDISMNNDELVKPDDNNVTGENGKTLDSDIKIEVETTSSSLLQVNDENTNVISNQIDNNHVNCNGDIDHSLDTTVDISMNNDEQVKPDDNNVTGENGKTLDSDIQIKVETTSSSLLQVNDENTNVIRNQIDNNHVNCNGEIDHSLDTTIDISMNNDELVKPDDNNVTGENGKTLDSDVQIEVETTSSSVCDKAGDGSEGAQVSSASVLHEESMGLEHFAPLEANKSTVIKTNQEKENHDESVVDIVNKEDCESRIAVDYSKINDEKEPESLKIRNNNYKTINGVTKTIEAKVNGFIDSYQSMNVVEKKPKSKDVDETKSKITKDTVLNVDQSKGNISKVSKNQEEVESFEQVLESLQEVVESLQEVVKDSQEVVAVIDSEIPIDPITENTTKVSVVENDVPEHYKDSDDISTSSSDSGNIQDQHSKSSFTLVETDKNESESKYDKNVDSATFESNDDSINHKLRSRAFKVDSNIDQNIGNHIKDCTAKDNHENVNNKLESSWVMHKSKSDKNMKLLDSFSVTAALNNSDFIKYMELKQDSLMDENPELARDDIVSYLYKTWQYEENSKSDAQKTNEKDASSLVKGIIVDHVPRFRSKKRILSVKLTRHKTCLGNALDKIEDRDEISSISSQGSQVSSSRKKRSSASKSPSVYSTFATKVSSDDFEHKETADETFSITSDSSRTSRRKLRSRNSQSPEVDENDSIEQSQDKASDIDYDPETASIHSQTSSNSVNTNTSSLDINDKLPSKVSINKIMEIPEFVKYVELNQDNLIEQNPDLTQDEIITYLYKTWQYEESCKSDTQKTDDIVQSNLVKGTNQNPFSKSLSRLRKRVLRVRLSDYSTESDHSCDKANDDDSGSIFSEKCEDTTKNINEDVIKKKETDESVEIKHEDESSVSSESEEQSRKRQLRSRISKDPCNIQENQLSCNQEDSFLNDVKEEIDDTGSIASQSSEISCKLVFKSSKSPSASEYKSRDESIDTKSKTDNDPDTVSLRSEDSTTTSKKRRGRNEKLPDTFSMDIALQIPEFVKYLELRQDAVMDENPQLSHKDIVAYLYKTWLYEESTKSEFQKTDEIDQSNLVKGLNQEPATLPKRIKKKIKKEPKIEDDDDEVFPKEKRKRNVPRLSYNEEYVDIDYDDSVPYFEIFKTKSVKGAKKSELDTAQTSKSESIEVKDEDVNEIGDIIDIDEYDEVEIYFQNLVKPKPNVFKGLVREKVCEICEKTSNLVKCKGCHGMFHVDCVNKETKVVEVVTTGTRGRKKKKPKVRKPKNVDSIDLDESYSDGKSQNHSIDETQTSIDDLSESKTVTNVEDFEAQLEAKMKEMLDQNQVNYDSYSSDELCWSDTEAGKCKIVDVKLKPRTKPVDLSDFKCKDCQKYATPVCFVCNESVSKTGVEVKQKCNVAHCYKYYHLECLKVWPQTQFNSGEPSKNNKKINEHFEALTCPRHVCHTCVCDDPRGCKTRFSGDKLARCVRCPATYHSFTKCLPAGSQILTGSHIICPRHYENRPGKVPCHVNTGWCFICALGGSLICCEFCPTSFHAECLNIKPPEGGYMCEDCETGRLPLYGEMIWVKLGHYRWWPGLVLHPSEIPENILAVKHSPGEFVVRFFGQYDHYWVNRGRVFPFQEGDSGRVSSQKSKIDADFTMAMEHAQRACEILKSAPENEEESLDIASSLLPPHFVKLKVNKPCGSLIGKRVDIDESSLTQCECDPNSQQPCGPYTHCLNRMLLTECGPTCRAGERCNNRAFEKRQYPKLVPYRTPYRGWGLKTLEMIPAGQFVIEYVGELIDEEEFRRRMTRQHEIRDENYYFLTLDKERMIDAGPKGNLARFMNHCCEPNCETQKWTVLGDVRVGLFAIKDIPANSEVTFNYNFECVGIEKKKCLCGAKRCSGYIGAKPKQDEPQPKKTPKVNAKRSYKKRKPNESPSTKRPRGRPLKRRELTDIEKDLLIIKNATNSISSDSDSGRHSVDDSKALKRKRVSFSTEEGVVCNGKLSPSAKRVKLEDNASEG